MLSVLEKNDTIDWDRWNHDVIFSNDISEEKVIKTLGVLNDLYTFDMLMNGYVNVREDSSHIVNQSLKMVKHDDVKISVY